jgi:hypothetical protein
MTIGMLLLSLLLRALAVGCQFMTELVLLS